MASKPSRQRPDHGWKTSEFGVTATTVLGSLAAVATQLAQTTAAQGHDQTSMWLGLGALLASGIASGAYSHGRSKVKAASIQQQ